MAAFGDYKILDTCGCVLDIAANSVLSRQVVSQDRLPGSAIDQGGSLNSSATHQYPFKYLLVYLEIKDATLLGAYSQPASMPPYRSVEILL